MTFYAVYATKIDSDPTNPALQFAPDFFYKSEDLAIKHRNACNRIEESNGSSIRYKVIDCEFCD